MYDPRRELGTHAGWSLAWACLTGLYGVTDWGTHTVTLDRHLTADEQRCTIAHEVAHIERGEPPTGAAALACEESAIDRIVGARLIPLEALERALALSPCRRCVAELLHVDMATLEARISGLSTTERREIERTC